MCTNIGVNLPTVVSFLMLYSLRCGCMTILIWTLIRASFFLVFFVITLIEVFLPRKPPLGYVFPKKPSAPSAEEQYFFNFVAYLFMIVTEAFLIVFTIYLGLGLYYEDPGRLEQYLICRFVAWISEVVFLVVLCLTHNYLIGWYLIFLMIIILEFYSFIVVYSYYNEVMEDRKDNENELENCCS